MVVQSQDRTKFALEELHQQEEYNNNLLRDKLVAVMVPAKHPLKQILTQFKQLKVSKLEEPNLKLEVQAVLTQLDPTIMCPHKIR